MDAADFKTFVNAYLVCALWSSTDNADDSGGEPLDTNYDVDDLAPGERAKAEETCKDFVDSNAEALRAATCRPGYSWGSAGHDFWLTRNGHGAGYFDRGLGVTGGALQSAAKVYNSCDIYVGDDGKLYFQ